MKAVKEKQPSRYSVKAACKLLGIGPHTLRAWEVRYGAVEPIRTAKGQRTYTDNQIERLQQIVKLANFGHSVGIVARMSDCELKQLLENSRSKVVPDKHHHAKVLSLFELLEQALNKFDIHGVSSILDQRRNSLGARLFILEVLVPLMTWIGLKVEKNKLSIAHEHALSAVVRDQIYQTLRYGAQPISGRGSPNFVLAAPEDDLHEFGILMSSALLSNCGLQNHFLGANLPVAALAIAVKAVRGKVIILGNAPVPDSERRISFEDYLKELHRLIPKDVAIWIGGGGKVPHLRHALPGRESKFISSLEELDNIVNLAPKVSLRAGSKAKNSGTRG